MIFVTAPLADVRLIELEPKKDLRGFYARAYCEREFSEHGLNTRWQQANQSYSASPGTLRGLHFQRGADAEFKLVRCLRGAAYDVIIDLRLLSPTRHQWFGVELDAKRPRWLYVPKGFAHGFVTLTPEVEVEYLVSAPYTPEAQWGVRYNDPYFNIRWPCEVRVISPQDESWTDFDPASDHFIVGDKR